MGPGALLVVTRRDDAGLVSTERKRDKKSASLGARTRTHRNGLDRGRVERRARLLEFLAGPAHLERRRHDGKKQATETPPPPKTKLEQKLENNDLYVGQKKRTSPQLPPFQPIFKTIYYLQ